MPVKAAFADLETKLAPIDPNVSSNLALLGSLNPECRVYPPGAKLFEPGSDNDSIFLSRSGWGYRYCVYQHGRNQILNFSLPGDMTSPNTFASSTSLRGVTAITSMQVYVFDKREILRLSHANPHLYLTWMELVGVQLASLEDRIVDLGCRSAYERLLRFILELWYRLKAINLADDNGFYCPITQVQFSEALGLSAVHTSRTFSRMSKEGLIKMESDRISILNERGAIAACALENTYLRDEGTAD
jgi:CRP-like cAMP-binding protein